MASMVNKHQLSGDHPSPSPQQSEPRVKWRWCSAKHQTFLTACSSTKWGHYKLTWKFVTFVLDKEKVKKQNSCFSTFTLRFWVQLSFICYVTILTQCIWINMNSNTQTRRNNKRFGKTFPFSVSFAYNIGAGINCIISTCEGKSLNRIKLKSENSFLVTYHQLQFCTVRCKAACVRVFICAWAHSHTRAYTQLPDPI